MQDNSERWYIFDEITTVSSSALEFGEMIGRKVAREFEVQLVINNISVYGDPAGIIRNQGDGQDLFSIFNRASGLKARRALDNNDPWIRRQPLRMLFSQLRKGKPAIKISKNCKMLIKGFEGGFCYKEKDERYDIYGGEPKVIKNEYSHPIEALEYLLIGAGELHKLKVGLERKNTGFVSAKHQLFASGFHGKKY